MLTVPHSTAKEKPCSALSTHPREIIERGIASSEFETLQTSLAVSAERLARVTGIHPRTLQRRRQEGTLTFIESDRLWRFQDLFARTSAAMESSTAAASWLTRANPRFEGLAPLEFAATEPGYHEVLLVIETIADDSFG